MEYVKIKQKRGLDIIHDPLENRGSGFNSKEREELGLKGLVPPQYFSIKEQLQRVMQNYQRIRTNLDRYIFLEALHDRNETLYYRLLLDYIEKLTPIVYTPTVGLACQQFGNIFRIARGMYFGSSNKGKFDEIIKNWPYEVDIIVVTDGSRILGLGDLGVSGMGIPIGKLSLYVACAGIHPRTTLPVVIDVGTNNENLLNDSLYMGERHKRISGKDYDEIIEEFLSAVTNRWKNVLIQFEDFTNNNAFPILDKYRNKYLCFNDDIQGTGAVAVAGILAAMRYKNEKLTNQKIVCFGAGSAAIGILNLIVAAIKEEGISEVEACKRIWLIDSMGLVTMSRGKENISSHKIPFARKTSLTSGLAEIIESVKPSILLGISGQPQSFSEQIIKNMNKHCKRPVIFALSNPTSKAECTANQVYSWTNGEAVFASGSPFSPIEINGKTLIPGQGNNMYIFPGVGLGSILGELKTISEDVFLKSAKVLANSVRNEDFRLGRVYPPLTEIRNISLNIATEICTIFSTKYKNFERDKIKSIIKDKMYFPNY